MPVDRPTRTGEPATTRRRPAGPARGEEVGSTSRVRYPNPGVPHLLFRGCGAIVENDCRPEATDPPRPRRLGCVPAGGLRAPAVAQGGPPSLAEPPGRTYSPAAVRAHGRADERTKACPHPSGQPSRPRRLTTRATPRGCEGHPHSLGCAAAPSTLVASDAHSGKHPDLTGGNS